MKLLVAIFVSVFALGAWAETVSCGYRVNDNNAEFFQADEGTSTVIAFDSQGTEVFRSVDGDDFDSFLQSVSMDGYWIVFNLLVSGNPNPYEVGIGRLVASASGGTEISVDGISVAVGGALPLFALARYTDNSVAGGCWK